MSTGTHTLGYYWALWWIADGFQKCWWPVIADASPGELGAVFVQTQVGGPRVSAFASRPLTAVEWR